MKIHEVFSERRVIQSVSDKVNYAASYVSKYQIHKFPPRAAPNTLSPRSVIEFSGANTPTTRILRSAAARAAQQRAKLRG